MEAELTGGNGVAWRETLRSRVALLFAAVVLVHLIPIWAFQYFPSDDGPMHLHTAQVLLELGDPAHPIYAEYFRLSDSLVPNLLIHYVLSGLMRIVPPLVAEKILLTLYVVSLPAAAVYALKAMSDQPVATGLLIAPFIYAYVLMLGFYNFSVGMVLFFVGVGYWYRVRDGLSARSGLVLALLCLLTFLCHVFAAVNLVFFVAVTGGWTFLLRWIRGDVTAMDGGRGGIPTRAILVSLVLLPTLVLIVPVIDMFGLRPTTEVFPLDRLIRLGTLSAIVSLSEWEYYVFSIPVVVLLGILFSAAGWKRIRRFSLERSDGILLALIGFVAVYFVIPKTMFLLDRLMPYLFFTLVLWLGTQPVSKRLRAGVAVAVALLTVGVTAARVPKFAELNGYVDEYVSAAPHIEAGSTLLALRIAEIHHSDGRRPGYRITPIRHASGYIAVKRHAVGLVNYQARTDYFPVKYRSDRNPYEHIARTTLPGDVGPDVEFRTYGERTGGSVDYVLLWGPPGEVTPEDRPLVRSIFEQLAGSYELIEVSPRGLMRLYRRNGCCRVPAADESRG